MGPVFLLVLDVDVPDHIAMMYPELYKELQKVPRPRAFSLIDDLDKLSNAK